MATVSPTRPLIVDQWRVIPGVVDGLYIPAASGDGIPCKGLVRASGAGTPDEVENASLPGQRRVTIDVWPLRDDTGEFRPRYLQQKGHFAFNGREYAIEGWVDDIVGDQLVKWIVNATTEQPDGDADGEGP